MMTTVSMVRTAALSPRFDLALDLLAPSPEVMLVYSGTRCWCSLLR